MTQRPQLDLFGSDGARVRPAPASPHSADIAAKIPSSIRLGTSSWSFPGWNGIVYDGQHTETQLARHGLTAYAQHPLLRTVGIDRTYCAPVDSGTFASYAADVPDDFRFLVKADRLLLLPDDDNRHFMDAQYAADLVIAPALTGLGEKAGPILFQFSPMHESRVGGADAFAHTLYRFLSALPAGPLYAVELRTPSLFTRAYADALRACGAAHAYTVHGSMLPLSRQLELFPVAANPALVLRWMLHRRHGYDEARAAYAPFNRIIDQDDATRHTIIAAAISAVAENREAFIIVNNKAEGSSPLSVFALAEKLAEA